MPSWVSNVLGLAGMLLLAVPALRLDAAARRVTRLERVALGEGDDEFLRREREALTSRVRRAKETWNPLTRYCLYCGYTLLLFSYLVRLFLEA